MPDADSMDAYYKRQELRERVAQLEDALRDCLFALQVYAKREGLDIENAMPNSAIGKGRIALGIDHSVKT